MELLSSHHTYFTTHHCFQAEFSELGTLLPKGIEQQKALIRTILKLHFRRHAKADNI